jgi:uridine kinase
MDNFYLSKTLKSFPKDENGKNDLEHVDALDLKLFDELLYKLIQGQPVKLPIYDFKTDKRDFTEPVILKENQPIIIEGIHGLNPKIAPSIPDSEKFKIFIAPSIQYKIDNENPIPIADVRLIRRMVRDYLFRGASAELTLSSWASVRKGEYRWIYPYCDSADYVFNSELSYELFVMKKYGLHILEDIKQNSKYFMKANGLIKFLKYFNSITDKWIPCNSILKEFLGGSIFYTTDKK